MPLALVNVTHTITDLSDLDEMESMIDKPCQVYLNDAIRPGIIRAVNVVNSTHQEDGTILREVVVTLALHIIEPWEPPVP